MTKQKSLFPAYVGDPFPETLEERKQRVSSLHLGRQWSKYNRGIQRELQRIEVGSKK